MSTQVQELIQAVNDELVADKFSGEKLNKIMKTCSLNLSMISSLLDPVPVTLLKNIKNLLLTDDGTSGVDFEIVLDLLHNLFPLCTFQSIISVFNESDIRNALQSKINPLIRTACKVISNSSPLNALQESGIFEILLDLHYNKNTDISIINDIELCWGKLVKDKNVQGVLLGGNCLTLLRTIRKSNNPILVTRLFALLEIIVPYTKESEFNSDLFIFSASEILATAEEDITYFTNIILYCIELVEISQTYDFSAKLSHNWLTEYLVKSIEQFGAIYRDIDNYIEVKLFSKKYLFRLFAKVSFYKDSNLYHSLDLKYFHINELSEDILDFLSFSNPSYLLQFHSDLCLKFSVLKPSNITVIRNLVSNEKTFNLIKENITSDLFVKMPYMEQMVLWQKISQFEYCVKYLVTSTPSIISSLLNTEKENIVEPETVELRRQTFDNLLKLDDSIFDVWLDLIKKEYISITNGKPIDNSMTKIADEFAQ